MTPPPRPFRLVYRAFDTVEFDPVKSGEVLAVRGFDLAHAARLLPGYVLEREDTRGGYREPRFRIIGEVLQQVLVVISTLDARPGGA